MPHSCNICGVKFQNQSELQFHEDITVHHVCNKDCGDSRSRAHQCPRCSMEFDDVRALHIHQEAELHGNCSYCGLVFAADQQLELSLHRWQTHRCLICGTECPGTDTLLTHCIAKHGPAVCDICGQHFLSLSVLQQHMKQAHVQVKQAQVQMKQVQVIKDSQLHQHHCGICLVVFPTSDDLRAHQQVALHLYCRPCEIFFPSRGAHGTHAVSLHAYLCMLCQDGFASPGARDAHSCRVCRLCDEVFSTDAERRTHAETRHVSEFRCVQCDRAFASSAELVVHCERMHPSGPPEAPWYCVPCARAFGSVQGLATHCKNKHTPQTAHAEEKDVDDDDDDDDANDDVKPTHCARDGCSRTFASVAAMVMHMESGACISGFNHTTMAALVVQLDGDHRRVTDEKAAAAAAAELLQPAVATNPSELVYASPASPPLPAAALSAASAIVDIDDNNSDDDDCVCDTSDGDSDVGVPLYTPTSSRSLSFSAVHTNPLGLLVPSTASASEQSLVSSQPQHLVCPLCAPDHPLRRFSSEQALAQHMASPAHAPKVFRCPSLVIAGSLHVIKRRFATFSGVLQHLESKGCEDGDKIVTGILDVLKKKLAAGGMLMGGQGPQLGLAW